MKVRNLLTHTAGLVDWFPVYAGGEGRAAYARTLASLDSAAPPGTKVVYSCLGYLFLSEIVERVASATLDALFRERIAAPLSLSENLLFSPASPEDLARCAGGERDDATERKMTAERGIRYGGFRSGVVNGQTNDGNAFRRGDGVSLNAGLFGTAAAAAALGRAWLVRDPRLLPERLFADATRNAAYSVSRAIRRSYRSMRNAATNPLAAAANAYVDTSVPNCALFQEA